jgi:hypothetical protein
MKSSPNEKMDSKIKEYSIITLTIIGIIIGALALFRENLPELWDGIDSLLKTYPIFSGAMFSWGFAVLSTSMVLFFAYINLITGKTDQYEKILEKSKKWLMVISIAVLFYISINLASEALTGTGVPIFSEPYKIGPFTHVSSQDVFLIFLVFLIIFLVFAVAPRYEHAFTRSTLINMLIIISGILIIICSLFFLFYCYAEPISEPPQNRVSKELWPFGISAVVGILLSVLFYLKMPKEAKDGNFRDLCIYFSVVPAFVVASLVLIGHKLVTYPNIAGHMVVGFLFISGFATLVILTMILLKDVKNGRWIWGFTLVASLAAISSFSVLFLFLEPRIYEIDTFRKVLTFSIVIILVIFQYGFSYEKLLKYRFTEWWRREVRPTAMVISILAILIISALNPDDKLFKLLWIFIALCFVVFLPWLLGMLKFWKNIKFRKFKLEIPLPKYQGMVLVKAKTDLSSLKEVVKELDGMEGVYQTKVVRGDYDVCLTVEGVNSEDIVKKILKIRKIYGVASTTTLTDIREFFDREVK